MVLCVLSCRVGSDTTAEDRGLTKEEPETAGDIFDEPVLSGFGGLVLCFSSGGGQICFSSGGGQICFGESVGVPLWLE